MSIEPLSVLQADRVAAVPTKTPSRERILVAGAVGRMGEALLNEVIGRGGYREVVALIEDKATVSISVRRLSLAPIHALPQIDAVCIAHGDPGASDARSHHGRDAPFALIDTATVPRIAEAAAAAGARRLLLIDPMPAWQQMSRFHLGLSGEAELAMTQLPFESIVVLRPLSTASTTTAGVLQRIASVYMSLQFLMMPRSLPTLTSVQIARIAVGELRVSAPGVRILGAAQIAERLPPVSGKR
jgi:hypothetical protein